MPARRILYFTAEGQYLYLSTRDALELEARFSPDESGVSAFTDYLSGHRGGLF